MATVGETHNIYTDQKGKFPIMFSWGNKYILIIYVYDANAILESLMRSKSSRHILEAYTKQVEHITHRGYITRVHWLDN